uniref:Uncharacterized protein n=1 Tax=Pyrodinium bahamense TaxID=73915 RepID=A0A7S0FVM5_9DINO|mmetsp:Transcript_52869/g.146511  ORF Transcript_52869/g.146511 Transcript_52869/m.146511 type:complete len:296 (+) Transcript_52869:77-964(+)
MAPALVAEDGTALDGRLASDAVDDDVKVEPPRVQWDEDGSEGDETSGDDSSDMHGTQNEEQDSIRQPGLCHDDVHHHQGHAWQATGDESSGHADAKGLKVQGTEDLKVQGKEDHVPCVGGVSDASGKMSVNESTVSADVEAPGEVKSKKHRVRWADDVNDTGSNAPSDQALANPDALSAAARGMLKQKLGHSKARRWLMSGALEGQEPMDFDRLYMIAVVFQAVRREEGAAELTIFHELSLIDNVLRQEMQRCTERKWAEAAAKRAEWRKAQCEILRSKVRSWVRWYTLSLFRMA